MNDPALIQDLFNDRGERFAKTDPARPVAAQAVFPASVMNCSGTEWQDKRRRLQPGFGHDRVLAAEAVALTSTAAALKRWAQSPQRVDLRADLGALYMNLGARFLFGRDAGRDETQHIAAMADALMRVTSRSAGLLRYVPTASSLRLRWARRRLTDALSGILDRAGRERADPASLLGTILDGAGEDLTPWLHDEFAALVLAGLEPMADALTWTLWLVARHPAVARALHHEGVAVATGSAGRLAVEDLARLHYAEAVVRESLRLWPPVWITGRYARQDCRFGGHRVPAGTQLLVSQWATHRDPRYFPEPERFWPERWLDRDWRAGLPEYAYFPFGGGQRKCVGSRLALAQMRAVLAAVIQDFELFPAPDARVRPHPALVLRPLGVSLTLQARLPAGSPE